MNDFWEMMIPAMTVSFIFLIVFGFFAFMRYLRYKETIALAERGLLQPERQRVNQGNRLFKWGILILCVGIGMFCTFTPIGILAEEEGVAIVGAILGALPASFGFGLILVDRYTHHNDENSTAEEDDPIPPHKV